MLKNLNYQIFGVKMYIIAEFFDDGDRDNEPRILSILFQKPM